MPKLKNVKREKFAQQYVNTNNWTASATKAGYSPNTAHVQGSRLLKNDKVSERIEALRQDMEDKAIITREEIMIWFKNNAELAQTDGKYADFNTAYNNLWKILWIYEKDNEQGKDKTTIVNIWDISAMTAIEKEEMRKKYLAS